ncbi:MAG: HEAT repeat domain-containing protein [Planctomycetota bacterium]|nr:HEAT repeat domain-containing protein [Planctomycetota bacterium]
MRHAQLLGLMLVSACSSDATPAAGKPRFELRAVVKPALAEAAARAPLAAIAGAAADPEAVDAVLGTLGSPDARLHGLALEDAKALGDSALPALVAVLADPAAAPARRNASAQALGAIATLAAVDGLLTRLEADREPWLRAQCAWQIRMAGRDEAVPRLVLRLKYEADSATVIWIADALASFGNLSGLEGLRVLRDTAADGAVRAAAAERLAALAGERGFADGDALYGAWWRGEPLAGPAAREPSPELLREAWDRIGRLAEWDLRRVDDARFVLVRLDAWVVPMLTAALRDADVYTRVHAAQCLERRGPRARAAVPELVAGLAEPRLAPGAAAALAAIGERGAAAPLEELLRTTHDVELRIAAARALGAIGGASTLDLLRGAWKPDQPIDLRQAAAGSLVALGEGDAVAPFLLECLGSPQADASSAEHALGAWIQGRAERGAGTWREFSTRWIALEPAPGTVPDAAEVARRRAQRTEIARAAIQELGS